MLGTRSIVEAAFPRAPAATSCDLHPPTLAGTATHRSSPGLAAACLHTGSPQQAVTSTPQHPAHAVLLQAGQQDLLQAQCLPITAVVQRLCLYASCTHAGPAAQVWTCTDPCRGSQCAAGSAISCQGALQSATASRHLDGHRLETSHGCDCCRQCRRLCSEQLVALMAARQDAAL